MLLWEFGEVLGLTEGLLYDIPFGMDLLLTFAHINPFIGMNGVENAMRWNLPKGSSDVEIPIQHDCCDYTIIWNSGFGVIDDDAS